ncbi:MAG: hypothetical protein EKK62_03995 [Acidimicrobiia bacterium]|nr:MAG: hypothetical protein EKK62_03995 [Acidimicrobiia bacterium]
MTATVNERLADAAVGHAVDLSQYANHVVRRVIALLNRSDAELAARLTIALEQLPSTAFTVERLETLLQSVRLLNAAAYDAVGAELTAELRGLAAVESAWQSRTLAATLPARVQAAVGIAAVNAEQVFAAALARPFQGRLLAEWARSIESDRMARIRDAVRQGYVQQETVSDIVRRIRGTRARGYADGLLEIDRRSAEAVVRTAVSHIAGYVRDRAHEANAGVIKAEQWSSTLDTRTSEICRPRDGKLYEPKTHKPMGHSFPWLGGPGRCHWRCRSVSVPITKSFRELGIDADDLPPGERASMDGQVPADQTFAQWLRKQPAARQDEVLGPVRAAMFRAGTPLDSFYDARGRYLTLEELRQR